MKKFMLFIFLLSSVSWLHGAVHTLNNANPSPGQYATYTAAEAAASAGDTILVHGSSTGYGSISMTKALTLIGPGHRPATPGNLSALFTDINLGTSGISISGVRVSGALTGSGISGIAVSLSRCGSVSLLNGCSTVVMELCIVDQFVDLDNSGSGIEFRNCHFTGGSFPLRNFGGTGNKSVTNNIFEGDGTQFLVETGGLLSNVLVANNIFFGLSPNAGIQTNCVYNNNITFSTPNNALPPTGQSGSGNKVNSDPQFVGASSPSGFAYTRNYRLQSGSPGLGAGSGGTNIGVYEPEIEFSMTGEPARPQTISVSATPTVPFGGTIQTDVIIRKSSPNAQ